MDIKTRKIDGRQYIVVTTDLGEMFQIEISYSIIAHDPAWRYVGDKPGSDAEKERRQDTLDITGDELSQLTKPDEGPLVSVGPSGIGGEYQKES